MRYVQVVVCVVAIIVLALACSDNGAGPDKVLQQPSFVFEVKVANGAGTPLQDLEVAVWSDLTIPLPAVSRTRGRGDGPAARPVTTLNYAIQERSDLELFVHKLDGELCDTLVYRRQPPGVHNVLWSFGWGSDRPSGVYECRMTARDTLSRAILYADTVYACLYKWVDNKLGVTDADGRYTTDDKLLFPGLLKSLPTLVQTTAVCDQIGTFSYGDSITIQIKNTQTSKLQRYRVKLTSGENKIDLVFNPTAAATAIGPQLIDPAVGEQTRVRKCERTAGAPAWGLDPPCPNPFN